MLQTSPEIDLLDLLESNHRSSCAHSEAMMHWDNPPRRRLYAEVSIIQSRRYSVTALEKVTTSEPYG